MKRCWLIFVVLFIVACDECYDVNCEKYKENHFNFVMLDDKGQLIDATAAAITVAASNGDPLPLAEETYTGHKYFIVTISPPIEDYVITHNGKKAAIHLELRNFKVDCCGFPYEIIEHRNARGRFDFDSRFGQNTAFRVYKVPMTD